jgi:hypothetical protein
LDSHRRWHFRFLRRKRGKRFRRQIFLGVQLHYTPRYNMIAFLIHIKHYRLLIQPDDYHDHAGTGLCGVTLTASKLTNMIF